MLGNKRHQFSHQREFHFQPANFLSFSATSSLAQWPSAVAWSSQASSARFNTCSPWCPHTF